MRRGLSLGPVLQGCGGIARGLLGLCEAHCCIFGVCSMHELVTRPVEECVGGSSIAGAV